MLEIVEILGPSKQGKTKPYLCRGDDDALYYIKGKHSGHKSQCCEWVVGCLAQSFGIPVAPFQQAHVSAALLAEAPAEWKEIGEGVVFASQNQEGALWFEPDFVAQVPEQLRKDVFAFDWWVQNMDRQSDNPNLLWANAAAQLVVIDYAFSFEKETFFPTLFKSYHIFAQGTEQIFGDFVTQAEYAERFTRTLASWDEACAKIHPSWLASADEDKLDFVEARQTLERCLTNELWRVE